MPTSGTGSLWRIISLIAGEQFEKIKISEVLENRGEGRLLAEWAPEPTGHLYMYNTPHIVNANFADPNLRIIINFRDPRDLACNQFYWALQHPMANRTPEQIDEYRRKVEEGGIDAFVVTRDNNILFKSLRALEARLQSDDPNVLKLSYSQLCLDFDDLVASLVGFFGADLDSLPHDALERERTSNLEKNPNWIGQMWKGTDIMPGRYRRELRRETIAKLDEQYRENLRFARSLEKPHLRPFLATESERTEMDRVLVGREDELFLKNDANNSVGQITGEIRVSESKLIQIAMAHRNRRTFGATLAHFDYYHAIIPSKEVVHRHLLPEGTAFEGQGARPLRQYLDAGMGSIWRPFYEPTLLEPVGAERFFPRTDSHWNHSGALRYLRGFLASALPTLDIAFEEIPLRRFAGRQQGDLGLKLEMAPEEIEIAAPAKSRSRLVFENGIVNEGCIRWYRNGAIQDGKRAFVMHDSFTLWLLGILPELFSEILLFHGTVFDYDFVERFAPDVVLCIQAERFFVRPPETGGNMLQFVRDQEQEKRSDKHFANALGSDRRFL
jgi:hypothetical protein